MLRGPTRQDFREPVQPMTVPPVLHSLKPVQPIQVVRFTQTCTLSKLVQPILVTPDSGGQHR